MPNESESKELYRAEKIRATDADPRLYKASPRGIGGGWSECSVFGCKERHSKHDCSFFVPSRETGDVLARLFNYKGAYLDYRHSEPEWIQFKVNVCDKHLDRLEKLVESVQATKVRLDGPGISEEMANTFLYGDDPVLVGLS